MPRKRYGKRKAKTPKVSKAVKTYVDKKIDTEIENKYANAKNSSVAVDSTSLVLSTGVTLVQGTSVGTRIGNKIRQKKCDIRFQLRNGNPGVVGTQKVRMIALFDKNPNGVIATTSELLIDNTSAGLNWLSPLNPNYFSERFTLVRDKVFDVPQANASAVAWGQHHRELFDLKGRILTYTSNTGLFASVASGIFMIYFISDTGAASSPPLMDYQIMIEWEDA